MDGNRHDDSRGSARGQRLETFVDAAFAFALTLLVISFDEIPASYDELVTALRSAPAFVASFAIIVMLWIGHRAWSRRYGLDDTPSLLISLALVLIVMIYVYPLRAMMGAALSAITGGWVPAGFRLASLQDVRGLFTIYGLGFAASVTCIALLYAHALRLGKRDGWPADEQAGAFVDAVVWGLVASFGLVSVLIARVAPDGWVSLAGWVYSLLGICAPFAGWLLKRRAGRETAAD